MIFKERQPVTSTVPHSMNQSLPCCTTGLAYGNTCCTTGLAHGNIPETSRDNRKWRVATASHDYNGNDAKMTKMATIKLAESYSGPQAS